MTDTAADYQTEAVTLAQQTAEYRHATQTATLTGHIFREGVRMSKTMAEVLTEHAFHLITPVKLDDVNGPWQVECNCTAEPIQGPSYLDAETAFAAHQAAALSAAGFGLVTDAKAEGARAAIAYLREGMGPWAEPRVLGFLEGAHSVAAHIVEDS